MQTAMQIEPEKRKKNPRTLVAALLVLVLIPALIALGVLVWDDRKYYIVSIAVIVLSMLPFAIKFEGRKPQAREIVLLAVMIAIGVAGRAAFYMVPQFKPVIAIVIITAIAFGPESGFVTGAAIGFISNFFFGQGPWTPWQMFGFGIIGFLAGLLFQKGWLPVKRLPLCLFGGLSTLFIYGFVADAASLFTMTAEWNWQTVLTVFATGLPFNLIHAAATVFFLFVLAKPMLKKLDRMKEKFCLLKT